MKAIFILVINWLAAFANFIVWMEKGSDFSLAVAVFSFTFGLLMSIFISRD